MHSLKRTSPIGIQVAPTADYVVEIEAGDVRAYLTIAVRTKASVPLRLDRIDAAIRRATEDFDDRLDRDLFAAGAEAIGSGEEDRGVENG